MSSYWKAFTLPLEDTLRRLISFVPRFFIAALLFLIFYGIAFLVRRAMRKSLLRFSHLPASVRILIARSTYILILLLGFMVALSAANVNVTAVLGSLGVAGFALGFALKDILENFIAGILLLFSRPFEVGDQVTLGNFEGTVADSTSNQLLCCAVHDGQPLRRYTLRAPIVSCIVEFLRSLADHHCSSCLYRTLAAFGSECRIDCYGRDVIQIIRDGLERHTEQKFHDLFLGISSGEKSINCGLLCVAALNDDLLGEIYQSIELCIRHLLSVSHCRNDFSRNVQHPLRNRRVSRCTVIAVIFDNMLFIYMLSD